MKPFKNRREWHKSKSEERRQESEVVGEIRDLNSEKDWAAIPCLKINWPLSLGMWVASEVENDSQPKANKETETSVL